MLLIVIWFLPDIVNKSEKYNSPTTTTIANNWSTYQGLMNWNAAKAKCASLKMMLPTSAELKTAYDLGVTKSWEKDGHNFVYWTFEQYSSEMAYIFLMEDGYSYINFKNGHSNVRCIR